MASSRAMVSSDTSTLRRVKAGGLKDKERRNKEGSHKSKKTHHDSACFVVVVVVVSRQMLHLQDVRYPLTLADTVDP